MKLFIPDLQHLEHLLLQPLSRWLPMSSRLLRSSYLLDPLPSRQSRHTGVLSSLRSVFSLQQSTLLHTSRNRCQHNLDKYLPTSLSSLPAQGYSYTHTRPEKSRRRSHDSMISPMVGKHVTMGVSWQQGMETGTIQVFDVNSRAILKTWKEQKQPVHTVKWSPKDITALMSCGDDRTVRLWDLPSEASIHTFRGHQDYVRTGAFLPGQTSSLMVSGSYDQTVRLWDPRTPVGSCHNLQTRRLSRKYIMYALRYDSSGNGWKSDCRPGYCRW